ncbi:hypothetical protein QNA08_00990 [Chelatococcus sp. SYSU_G07232]|uniref:Uncharacterized protein n=1 Tax=Chelatococcus albus TaxID=3047466 RepID=A0ABT7ACN5_9HYPH|nr:hypothetical protein [Chelatococcus sp. SYSU_G07232]MDJ1156820.1 hypothetical protein [Chelatococcus sp. SYSU_G07232]
MAISEQDLMEDLAYAEAEGPADMFEDDLDAFGGEEDSADLAGDFFGEDEGDYYEDEMEAEEADESVGQLHCPRRRSHPVDDPASGRPGGGAGRKCPRQAES